jgi:hypothetical protein
MNLLGLKNGWSDNNVGEVVKSRILDGQEKWISIFGRNFSLEQREENGRIILKLSYYII